MTIATSVPHSMGHFTQGDQFMLNAARSVGMEYALIHRVHMTDGRGDISSVFAVGWRADLLTTARNGMEVVALDQIAGL